MPLFRVNTREDTEIVQGQFKGRVEANQTGLRAFPSLRIESFVSNRSGQELHCFNGVWGGHLRGQQRVAGRFPKESGLEMGDRKPQPLSYP